MRPIQDTGAGCVGLIRSVIVVGGGLEGLSAACALADVHAPLLLLLRKIPFQGVACDFACAGFGQFFDSPIALAMILMRHRLSVVPNVTINRRVQVMMSPKRGLPMTIHDQDRGFRSAPVRGNIHEMVELN